MSDSDVTRVNTPEELPDEALLTYAFGHQWSEPPMVEVEGWGLPAAELRLTCPCGRWRKDVIGLNSGKLFSRDYGGGTLLAKGIYLEKDAARLLWARRVREREAEATRLSTKRQAKNRARRGKASAAG